MPKNSNGQILIVDDDDTSRRALARILAAAGYQCREAESGAEALKLVQIDQPSLLLLDFEMPGLDGAEVMKQLRADPDPAGAPGEDSVRRRDVPVLNNGVEHDEQ